MLIEDSLWICFTFPKDTPRILQAILRTPFRYTNDYLWFFYGFAQDSLRNLEGSLSVPCAFVADCVDFPKDFPRILGDSPLDLLRTS